MNHIKREPELILEMKGSSVWLVSTKR